MLAVDRRVAEFREHDVARDDHLLTSARPAGKAKPEAPLALVHDTVADDRVVLAVVHDGETEHAGVFHCAAHDFVVLNAVAIVGECDHSGIKKRSDRSKFLAFQPLGDRSGAENIHTGFARCLFLDPSDRCGAVGRRIGIRHGDDGSESSCRCGACAAGHCLFVRLAWLAQVDMDVDQTRRYDEADGVNGLGLLARHRLGDLAIGDPEVGGFVTVVGRVDDAAIGNTGDFFHVGTPAPPAQE